MPTVEAAGIISAGILALIIIVAVIALVAASYGAKRTWDYLRGRKQTMGTIGNNPLYREQTGLAMNPLYASVE